MCRVLLLFLYIVPLCSPVLPSMGGGKGYGERKDHGKEHVRVKEGEKLGGGGGGSSEWNQVS